MKPVAPVSHPLVTEGKANWMFIPREMVTLDGSECNKIGVGYSAFRNEASNFNCLMQKFILINLLIDKCEKLVGSCLKN